MQMRTSISADSTTDSSGCFAWRAIIATRLSDRRVTRRLVEAVLRPASEREARCELLVVAGLRIRSRRLHLMSRAEPRCAGMPGGRA